MAARLGLMSCGPAYILCDAIFPRQVKQERALMSPLRLSKKLHGRCRRARRPSDCNRIAGLCRAGGAVSASAETIPYIFHGRQPWLTVKNARFRRSGTSSPSRKSGRSHFFDTLKLRHARRSFSDENQHHNFLSHFLLTSCAN